MMSDEDRRNLFDNSLELGPPTSTLTLTNQGPSTKPDKKPKGAGAGAGGVYGGKNTQHPLAGGPGGVPASSAAAAAAASSSSSQPSNSLTRRLEKLGFGQGVGADRCVVPLSLYPPLACNQHPLSTPLTLYLSYYTPLIMPRSLYPSRYTGEIITAGGVPPLPEKAPPSPPFSIKWATTLDPDPPVVGCCCITSLRGY